MFERALDRVTGQMHAGFHARAQKRLPELVHEILEDAVQRWAHNNWDRYDEREVNCTVQLYRWLQAAQRSDKRFHVLDIGLENVIPNPAMMEGTESVTTAARSDLRVGVRGGDMILEAKRLAGTGSWCREYVHAGMARFVEASYAATESVGMMVGYVQQPSTSGLRDRVNGYVHTHASMGSGHELSGETPHGISTWLTSTHQRQVGGPIDLRHLWIVLPTML